MIHEQLKAERTSRNISIRKMAELMKLRSKNGTLSWRLITKIEKGCNVNWTSYVRYAAALGLSIETVLKAAKK